MFVLMLTTALTQQLVSMTGSMDNQRISCSQTSQGLVRTYTAVSVYNLIGDQSMQTKRVFRLTGEAAHLYLCRLRPVKKSLSSRRLLDTSSTDGRVQLNGRHPVQITSRQTVTSSREKPMCAKTFHSEVTRATWESRSLALMAHPTRRPQTASRRLTASLHRQGVSGKQHQIIPANISLHSIHIPLSPH
jgi:hypothetical protein